MSCCYWSAHCPTYELLQVLPCSLYIPLEFVLVLTILSVSCRCIVSVAQTAIFKLVCLKRLVIFRISGLWYENVTHFFGLLCCCGWKFLSLFFGYQLLLQVVNDMQWKSIILGYCKYDFPFLLFSLFCDWQCYHSVYVKIKCSKFVFKWVVRRELHGNISMCRFPIVS